MRTGITVQQDYLLYAALPTFCMHRNLRTAHLFWPELKAHWFASNPIIPMAKELDVVNGDAQKAMELQSFFERRVAVCKVFICTLPYWYAPAQALTPEQRIRNWFRNHAHP